jgi:hypothetical protein
MMVAKPSSTHARWHTESYKKHAKKAIIRNPLEYWFRDGYAYLTPKQQSTEEVAMEESIYVPYLKATSPGRLIFAYESEKGGFVAVGVIEKEWDAKCHTGYPELFGESYGIYFRIKVKWIPDFKCAYDELKQAGFAPKNQAIDILRGEYLQFLKGRLDRLEMPISREEIEHIEVAKIENDESLSSTEKEQLIKARKGQGKFRDAVQVVENKCRLTGEVNPEMLRASHIKPWRVANNNERLDKNNGLMLSPHVDHLFDNGWITFDDNGKLIVSPKLKDSTLRAWHLPVEAATGSLNLEQRNYMKYHRDEIFKKT